MVLQTSLFNSRNVSIASKTTSAQTQQQQHSISSIMLFVAVNLIWKSDLWVRVCAHVRVFTYFVCLGNKMCDTHNNVYRNTEKKSKTTDIQTQACEVFRQVCWRPSVSWLASPQNTSPYTADVWSQCSMHTHLICTTHTTISHPWTLPGSKLLRVYWCSAMIITATYWSIWSKYYWSLRILIEEYLYEDLYFCQTLKQRT